MPYGIASVRSVFGSGKAIRSESANGTVWFYRDEAGDGIRAYNPDAPTETYSIDIETVERNVDHDDTDVETVPVDESPFGE